MKKQREDQHPLFSSCTWRFGQSISTAEKIKSCNECYRQLSESTNYCDHMQKFGIVGILTGKVSAARIKSFLNARTAKGKVYIRRRSSVGR